VVYGNAVTQSGVPTVGRRRRKIFGLAGISATSGLRSNPALIAKFQRSLWWTIITLGPFQFSQIAKSQRISLYNYYYNAILV
jgi:hypothetical protein